MVYQSKYTGSDRIDPIMLVYLDKEHAQLMGSVHVKQRHFAVASA